SDQTFEDLHNAIQKAVNFDNSQLASFYMSDDTWRKGLEITLMDMKGEEDETSGKIMNKCILSNFIDDPHQKILYVFDFLAMWTFRIELIKILSQDPKTTYPKCVKSIGIAPKQYASQNNTPVQEDEEEGPKAKRTKEQIFENIEEYEEELNEEN